MSDTILRITNLEVGFRTPFGRLQALRSVSLEVESASVLGLVGESGCGKTMIARAAIGLLPSNAIVSGTVEFRGQDLSALSSRQLQRLRGRKIAMVFQDPAAALNPVFTVGNQFSMAMADMSAPRKIRNHAASLLEEVGLRDPLGTLAKYPHQLSGGQQQRVMIALALAHSPELLIADEPTTALDVTVQAQILDLLLELRKSRGLSILLITHNMAVVARACQRVAVLYAGQLVEEADVSEILQKPEHPYTRALLASLPMLAAWREPLKAIPGVVPAGTTRLDACLFAPRCPFAMEICSKERPEMVSVHPRQQVACWLHPPPIVHDHA